MTSIANMSAASDDFVDAREDNMGIVVDRSTTPSNGQNADRWNELNGSGFTGHVDMDSALPMDDEMEGYITKRHVAPAIQSTPIRRIEPRTSTDTLPRPKRQNAANLPAPGVPVVSNGTQNENMNRTVDLTENAIQPTMNAKRNLPTNKHSSSSNNIKSDLLQTLSSLFRSIQISGEPDLDQLERTVQSAIAKAEEQWAAKVSKSTDSASELALYAVLQNIEESEKFMYDATVELASSNKENIGRQARKSVFNPVKQAEDPKLKEELEKAHKERDRLSEEYSTLENNYGDLFRRYEVLRENSQALKENETKLKQEAEVLAEKNAKLSQKLATAHEYTQEILDRANDEIEQLNAARETDNIALRMKVKQYASQMATLEATIQAKNQEIEEIQQICNELLQKAEIGDDEAVAYDY
ncbi:hypothetical protein QR680_006451 [Steinernema hermaphroditum]|uniref:Transforming acidic coiled-coil-containing protein C-terminal domain-containing protein n=1 Tax=Steinernema hermaphroditum TaxID=289476 RepID=A0AA39HX16_9BILA|nr:hypothetical protein QR680_006451 [Steinernema hermaphroditum]